MPKRSRPDDKDDYVPKEKASVGQMTSSIRNKLVRSEMYENLKHKAKKAKAVKRKKNHKEAERAKQMGLEPAPAKIPKTIENQRVKDETLVAPDDEEVIAEEAQDEFAAHFQNERAPKVLLTSCYKPSKIMYKFLKEMLELFPAAEYYKRNGFPVKKIVKFAAARDYTDLLVVNEDRRTINGLLHVHLPDGPTAHYRISNLKLGADIKGHGRATKHKPELVLNNFSTQMGRRVGRMLASLFTQDPNFRGRRVVTFHNQRDFVFVRHHRYIFEEKEKRGTGKEGPTKAVVARLQELGPRFTLKLQSLQHGLFDSKGGEFEWTRNTDTEPNRRKFYL